jgi:hypothetical protein
MAWDVEYTDEFEHWWNDITMKKENCHEWT